MDEESIMCPPNQQEKTFSPQITRFSLIFIVLTGSTWIYVDRTDAFYSKHNNMFYSFVI